MGPQRQEAFRNGHRLVKWLVFVQEQTLVRWRTARRGRVVHAAAGGWRARKTERPPSQPRGLGEQRGATWLLGLGSLQGLPVPPVPG